MENWTLERVIKWGRISVWIFLASFTIPLIEGFIIGLQEMSPREYEERLENLSPLTNLASFLIIPAGLSTIITATEASARTRSKRVTIRELNDKFTFEQVNRAASLYYEKPETFPWHHILMVPEWGLKLHLKNGWCGIPKHLLYSNEALPKKEIETNQIDLDKEEKS